MKKSSHKAKRSTPLARLRPWLLTLVGIVILLTTYIGYVFLVDYFESQLERAQYEMIPKDRPLATYITYTEPEGWERKENWVIQDLEENKRHQLLSYLSPDYSAPQPRDGCSIQLSARVVDDPLRDLTPTKNIGWNPYNIRDIEVDGFKAVRFNEDDDRGHYSERVRIARISVGQQRLWSIGLFCGNQMDLDEYSETLTELLESIKFK